MTKIQKLGGVILLCTGVMLWTPPCYSFGFPTFDIAEVVGTTKGVTTSVQSLGSTATSTTSQSKELLALGDNLSALTKFKDAEEMKKRAEAKAARIKKNKERLERLRKKIDKAKTIAKDVRNGIQKTKNTISEVKQTASDIKSTVDQAKDTVNSTKATVGDLSKRTQGIIESKKEGVNQNMVNPAVVAPKDNAPVVAKPAVTTRPAFSSAEETEVVIPEAKAPVVAKPAITTRPEFGSAEETEVVTPEAKAPVVAKPAVATKSVVNKPLIQRKTTRAFKQSAVDVLEFDYGFSVKHLTSYAQVYTGTNDDGRFLFSDIIATKCSMGYEDAEDEEKVKECIKTWVKCMAGIDESGNADSLAALSCKDEYKKAMHEQVAADLARSLSDKEYSNSFEQDVAEDLEKKSTELSSERDDIAYVGEIGKANQELVLRLMNSMSSRLLQESLRAVELLDASYYDEEG